MRKGGGNQDGRDRNALTVRSPLKLPRGWIIRAWSPLATPSNRPQWHARDMHVGRHVGHDVGRDVGRDVGSQCWPS
jgi:hypothetical protein